MGHIEAKQQQFCPPTLTIEMIRDRWSLLILRECFRARTHDHFLAAFSIAPSLLAEKLERLVASGLLRNIDHSRFVLTQGGRDFSLAVRSAMPPSCEQSAPPFVGITTCPDCSEVLATEMKGLRGRYRHGRVEIANPSASSQRVDCPSLQMKPSDPGRNSHATNG